MEVLACLLHLMPDQERLIQKLKTWSYINHVCRADCLSNMKWPAIWINAIVVERSPCFQPMQPFRFHEESCRRLLAVIFLDFIDRGIKDVGPVGVRAPILEDVVQAQLSGWDFAGDR